MNSRLVVFDLDNTLIDTSRQLNGEMVYKDIKELELLDGVREFLTDFPVRKILVTKENTVGLQKVKLDRFGIFDLFEEVIICNSNEEKGGCFKIIEENNEGVNVWAIGDRIDSEIRHANGLGWKTVLLKRGKYETLKAQDELEIPDYTINSFIEFGDLLREK